MTPGPIICIEGMDGCGKSTLVAFIEERLQAYKVKFPTYGQHAGALMGAVIDQHLKGYWRVGIGPSEKMPQPPPLMDAIVFQALQLVNRCEMAPIITQTVQQGTPVVLDRYWPSGYAYGQADGLDAEWLLRIHKVLPQPDLNLLLDIPPEVTRLRRVDRRDRYERLGKDFFTKVRDAYLQLWALGAAGVLPGRWVIIDATGDKDEVALAALDAIVGE